MAISLVGTASSNATGGGNVTVTLPGGTAQNDVVYGAYCVGNLSDLDQSMVTAGYTELADISGSDDFDALLAAYRKVQGGVPDTTAVFTGIGGSSSGCAGAVMVYRGVDTTTPEDAAVVTATGSNSAIPDPGSITTVTAGARVIAIGGSSQLVVPTAPSGYSNLIEDQASEAEDANIMMADKVIAAPAAENPGAFGVTGGDASDAWAAITIAVRPAAAATGRSQAHIYG